VPLLVFAFVVFAFAPVVVVVFKVLPEETELSTVEVGT